MASDAETIARKLFSERKTPREVKKALAELGMTKSISTIRTYYVAFKGGYTDAVHYIKDPKRTDKHYAHSELSKDPYFLQIAPSVENILNISESNPFMIFLRNLTGDMEAREMINKLNEGNTTLGSIEFLGYLRKGLKESGIMSEGAYASEITEKGWKLLKRYGASFET